MFDREVELVVTGRRAPSTRDAEPGFARVDDLRARRVVLQLEQVFAAEFGIADDDAVGANQRHASSERGARGVGERVGVHSGVPFAADEPRLALQLVLCFVGEPVRQTIAGDQDDDGDEQHDDPERAQQQPLGETHARRA